MLFNRISDDAKVLLFRQIALLLRTGLPIKEALTAVAGEELESPSLQASLSAIAGELEQGRAIDTVLQQHPRLFNPAVVALVKQEGGDINLAQLFNNTADEVERRASLRKRLLTSLSYPMAILTVAVVIFTILTIFVLPTFDKMYSDMSRQLPPMTRLVFGVSNFLSDFGPVLLGIVALLTIGLWRSKKTQHQLISLLPVTARLSRAISLITFLRNLGLFLGLGANTRNSLRYAAAMVTNQVHAAQLRRLAEQSGEEVELPVFFRSSPLFPRLAHQAMEVAQKSGTGPELLPALAGYFEKKLDRQLHRLLIALDIGLMLLVGVIIGTVVIAVYQPIFQLAG